jgi:hypothetical protein
MIVKKHYFLRKAGTSCALYLLTQEFAPQAISMIMYRIVKLKDKKICITILKTVFDC